MKLPRGLAGLAAGPLVHDVDARWLMAYAAGLGETDACYYNTLAPGGPAAHPLFPVCYEWPAIVALRGGAIPDEVAIRGVHATHDVTIHRPPRTGDILHTTARVVGLVRRRAGTLMIVREETVDAGGQPVPTTDYGSVYRGVDFPGEDVGESPSSDLAQPLSADAERLEIGVPAWLAHCLHRVRPDPSGIPSTPMSPWRGRPGCPTSSCTAPPHLPSPSRASSAMWGPTLAASAASADASRGWCGSRQT